jgi:hypothetical protein
MNAVLDRPNRWARLAVAAVLTGAGAAAVVLPLAGSAAAATGYSSSCTSTASASTSLLSTSNGTDTHGGDGSKSASCTVSKTSTATGLTAATSAGSGVAGASLGKLAATATSSAALTGIAGYANTSASSTSNWADTLTVTSSTLAAGTAVSLRETVTLTDTISATGGLGCPLPSSSPTVTASMTGVGSINDTLCSHPTKTVTKTISSKVGSTVPVGGTLTTQAATLPIPLIAPSLSANADASKAASYNVDVLTAGAGYSSASGSTYSTTLTPQAITFPALGSFPATGGDVTLAATASSGLPVSYALTAGAPCVLTGSSLHVNGTGSCTVTASQAGDSQYAAAGPVTQTATIDGGNTPTPGDVSLSYTGPTAVTTTGLATTTADVPLQATVTANSGTPTLSTVPVTFNLYSSSNLLDIVPDATCVASVTNAGIASCTATLAVDTWTVVAVVPSGPLFNAATAAPATLVISPPTTAKSIFGGGAVVSLTQTALVGLSDRFKPGTTTPSGLSYVAYKASNGNWYSVLGTSGAGTTLSFSGTTMSLRQPCAVIVYSPTTKKFIQGAGGTNFSCQIYATDKGTTGDTFAITVTTSTGSTFYSLGSKSSPVTVLGNFNVN